jgi:hypothetical protein
LLLLCEELATLDGFELLVLYTVHLCPLLLTAFVVLLSLNSVTEHVEHFKSLLVFLFFVYDFKIDVVVVFLLFGRL